MSTFNERIAPDAAPRGASAICPGSGRELPEKGVYTCGHCGRRIAAVGAKSAWSMARHYPGKTQYQPNTEPRVAAEVSHG